jgi:hypothetical protein
MLLAAPYSSHKVVAEELDD